MCHFSFDASGLQYKRFLFTYNKTSVQSVKSADRLFYLPEKSHLPLRTEDLRQWYHNLILENDKADYPSDTLSLLRDRHNYYGKFLSEGSREFFLNHFGRNLVKAINYFFGNHQNPIRFL